MWNYIKSALKNGSLLSKFLTVAFIFVAIMTAIAISGGAAKEGSATLLALFYLSYRRFSGKIKAFFQGVDTVPYWGSRFGRDACIKLLSEDRFTPYINERGEKIRGFSVSESGRWFCIKDRYYPTYLVYDYNSASAEITMIDGTQIDAGDWKYDTRIVKALNEYLNTDRNLRIDNAYHVMITTGDCTRAFKRSFQGDYESLASADWDEVRYRWEKELAEIEIANLNRMDSRDHAKALKKKDVADEALHTRVLMDEEIRTIADGITDKSITHISDWFKAEAFKDDMCIFNGVKLLKVLGYPENRVGTQFLFDCLKDIQKPYFEDAVITLERYPVDELIPIIESHVETAHATENVLWGAGLIYLSKRIGYTISLAKGIDEAEDPIAAIFRDKPEPKPMVQTQGKF